ncbi:hypothetical protein ONA70_20480 [Micromonospora yasonensis]|uniref:hypothetical protein n=1 Tax=Micromonospora yasonensis TaxID=1128667 RepID=UPI0022323048|nr:hypothetical protein [Micromonospora yasonensis]MCW3842479.1 hypothetical protein [Micromonospora yasonensis]
MDSDRHTARTEAGWPVAADLTDPRCADPSFGGPQVTLLATARHLLPVPSTVVLVGSPARWRAATAESTEWWASCPVAGPAPAGGPVPGLALLDGPVTARAWLAVGRYAGQLGPVFHNVGPDALGEVLTEFGGLGTRLSRPGEAARLVVSLQSFLPADVSVTVAVEQPGGPVRVCAHWGVDEDLGPVPQRHKLEFSWPGLTVRRYRLLHQATAALPAAGGTRLVGIPAQLRGAPPLSVDQAGALAAICGRFAERREVGVEWDVVLRSGEAFLVACRLR